MITYDREPPQRAAMLVSGRRTIADARSNVMAGRPGRKY
jgi:hypothetical protein